MENSFLNKGDIYFKQIAVTARQWYSEGPSVSVSDGMICMSMPTAIELKNCTAFKFSKFKDLIMKNGKWIPRVFGMPVIINSNLKENEIIITTDRTFLDSSLSLSELGRAIKKSNFHNNLVIGIKNRSHCFGNISNNERNAIDSLREMISEAMFRKYLKFGFILVFGKSGHIYQIFRNKSHIKVWERGNLVEEICVRIRNGDIPLTDNLIAFKIMIETDEEEFKKLSNVYKMRRAA